MAELDGLSMSLDDLIAKRGEEERKKQGQTQQGRGGGRGRAFQQQGGRGGSWQGPNQRPPGGRGRGPGGRGQPGFAFLPPAAFTNGFHGPQGLPPPFLPHREVFMPGVGNGFGHAEAGPAVIVQPPPVPPPQPPQLSAYVKPETQEVAVKFKQTEILKVREGGSVTLDSGGFRGPQFLLAMNEALKPLGLKISGPSFANWTISDGRSITRFEDGVVLPAKGALTENRAKEVLKAFSQNSSAPRPAAQPPALAEPPMLDDAIPNGIAPFAFMPQQMPPPFPRNPGGPGHPNHRIVNVSPNSQQKWRGSGRGEDSQHDRDRERRLRVKGRFMPY